MTVPQYTPGCAPHSGEPALAFIFRCHCEPEGAPQGGLSCPFGAIHLLAISWYNVRI